MNVANGVLCVQVVEETIIIIYNVADGSFRRTNLGSTSLNRKTIRLMKWLHKVLKKEDNFTLNILAQRVPYGSTTNNLPIRQHLS